MAEVWPDTDMKSSLSPGLRLTPCSVVQWTRKVLVELNESLQMKHIRIGLAEGSGDISADVGLPALRPDNNFS